MNIIRILNSKLNKLKNEILESEYFFEHQQIAYYFTLLQKLTDISQSNFRKFHKKTLQYFCKKINRFHESFKKKKIILLKIKL